jgi:hypothetical protein
VLAVSAIAAAAYLALGGLIFANGADRIVTLAVAGIGAVASIAAAFIARGNRRDINARRVVVSKHDTGVTVTDEELGALADQNNADAQ